MEIKLIEIHNATKVLQKIINFPMEIKLSYRLTKITKKLQSEFKEAEKIRIGLVKKYGQEDKEKGGIGVPKENLEEFFKELDAALEKITVLDMDLIPFELLVESKINLSPADLVAIEKFIEKEKE